MYYWIINLLILLFKVLHFEGLFCLQKLVFMINSNESKSNKQMGHYLDESQGSGPTCPPWFKNAKQWQQFVFEKLKSTSKPAPKINKLKK